MHHRIGKFHLCPWPGETDYFRYNDRLLYPFILCMESPVSDQRKKGIDCFSLFSFRTPHPVMPVPAKRLAARQSSVKLGHLPQHSLRTAWLTGYRPFLPGRRTAEGSRLPVDVADHCAQFRLLHPGSAMGRHYSYAGHADDSENLCLCLDRAHRLPCHDA